MDKTKTSAVVFINEDGVLTKILSKLPLKDVVKTSVLSRRWRYIWTYLPNIRVSCRNHHNLYRFYDLLEKETDKIVQIMDNVLKQHCGSGVETFSVDMPFYVKHAGSLDQWVAFAAATNTKEFFMTLKSMGNKCSYDFPFHLLFQQNWQSSIKCLGLRSCSLRVPDGIIGCLRSLQTLEIHYVSICDADFQNLVSICVIMEKLVVSSCTDLRNMSIHQQSGRLKHLIVNYCPALQSIDFQAKKLVNFVYRGNIINFSFQDVSSITEGEMSLLNNVDDVDFVLMKLPNLLPQFQKLKLGFHYRIPELIHMPKMSCHRFENLKHLTVVAIDFVNGGKILLLIALLTLAPCLEKLTLKLYGGNREMQMEVPIHNIPLAHLKEVEITGFIGSGQFKFLEYLFNNASTLRSMKICVLLVDKYYPYGNQRFLHSRDERISDYIKRIAPPNLDIDISYLTLCQLRRSPII